MLSLLDHTGARQPIAIASFGTLCISHPSASGLGAVCPSKHTGKIRITTLAAVCMRDAGTTCAELTIHRSRSLPRWYESRVPFPRLRVVSTNSKRRDALVLCAFHLSDYPSKLRSHVERRRDLHPQQTVLVHDRNVLILQTPWAVAGALRVSVYDHDPAVGCTDGQLRAVGPGTDLAHTCSERLRVRRQQQNFVDKYEPRKAAPVRTLLLWLVSACAIKLYTVLSPPI